MNQITKQRIGKNKWIVTHGDYPNFSLYERLKDTYPMFVLHRDGGYGYIEHSDTGHTTYYGRIDSLENELDEMNRQDVESRLADTIERIEYLQEGDSLRSYEMRDDGLAIGWDNNLYKKCSNGNYHRVYCIENTIVRHEN